jgi:hypothetical protein
MADQMNKNQGSNFNRNDSKSMPSQGQDQRRSTQQSSTGGSHLGNQQQQRNQKGSSDVGRNVQSDIDE